MASLNKAILIGNLGADPEVRYTANGDPVATIRLATSESWKDKTTGERKEQTEWHRIVFYSKLAEIVGDYLKKGSSVYIEGRIQTRKWQDQSGQERYTTEIVASEMRMLGSRGDRATNQAEHGSRADEASQSQYSNERGASDKQRAPEPVGAMDDDDIPF